MRRTRIGKFTVMVLAWMFVGPSAASASNQQDYCIKCVNPDETYICRITSSSGQSQGKQFLCIVNISKQQGHDSCSVTAQAGSCSGILVQYEVSGSAEPQIPANPASVRPEETPIPVPQNSEPKTLVEFTKQATKATQSGLKSAGENTTKAFKNTGKAIKNTGDKIIGFTDDVGSNIKKASKTTWQCLTSLFFNCSGN